MLRLIALLSLVALLVGGCGGYGSKSKSHYKKNQTTTSHTSSSGRGY
jgi:hypothetical protein